jgi:hypothetical protein
MSLAQKFTCAQVLAMMAIPRSEKWVFRRSITSGGNATGVAQMHST